MDNDLMLWNVIITIETPVAAKSRQDALKYCNEIIQDMAYDYLVEDCAVARPLTYIPPGWHEDSHIYGDFENDMTLGEALDQSSRRKKDDSGKIDEA